MRLLLLFFVPVLGMAKSLYIGYGQSAKPNPTESIREAYNMLPDEVKKPDFCVLFLTVDYNVEKVVKELRKFTGPKTKFYGETSCLGVGTKNGVIIGEKGSLALLAFKSDRIKFGVGSSIVSKKKSGFEAGKEAIQRAIKDVRKRKEKPRIVLISATPGIEEDVLRGIQSVIGKNVPIIGGSAADNEIKGDWKIISNDRVYSKGVSLTVIYTDLKVGYGFVSGYAAMDKAGVVTKAKGRRIYQIDNKPAGEVYNQWCDNRFSNEMKTGASILGPASFVPLAKKVIEKDVVKYITVHPARIDPATKSLDVFANVKNNDTLYLLKGDKDILLSRPVSVGMAALYQGKISSEELAGGIFIYCAGTFLSVKDEFGTKGIPPLVRVLNEKPFITSFTFGEQGFYKGIGNLHGNLMCSMVVFGE